MKIVQAIAAPQETGAIANDENEKWEKVNETISNLVQQLSEIEWNDMPNETKGAICSLATTVGKTIYKNMFTDADKQMKDDKYKDLSYLQGLDQKQWLRQREPLLLSFIFGATGVNCDNDSSKKINALTHSVEQLLYTRYLQCVTPFAFQRSIVRYSYTQCKRALELNSGWESCGPCKMY